MRARRPPPPATGLSLLVTVTVITAVTAAATPGGQRHSDLQILRAMQNEEGTIDKLIVDILELQEAKELAELGLRRGPLRGSHAARIMETPELRHGGGPDHPVRHFAYYPSDREYYQPRHRAGPHGPSHGPHGPSHGPDGQSHGPDGRSHGPDGPPPGRLRIKGQQETVYLVPGLHNLKNRVEPQPTTSMPDETYPDDVRDKRPMANGPLSGQAAELHGSHPDRDKNGDVFFIVAVVGICTGTVCVSVLGGVCYRYLQRRRRLSSAESGSPSYGVTGPHSALGPSASDRKLAQSAQLYHYQHQKQHMMAIQEGKALGRCSSPSDDNSDPENDESEHTVYECPGLAPSGEMEVKNPLFSEDPTPCQSVDESADP